MAPAIPIDWLQEFWRSAQVASPFTTMGAVLALVFVWRALRRKDVDLMQVTMRSIESQVNTERTLDLLLNGAPSNARIRKRKRRP